MMLDQRAVRSTAKKVPITTATPDIFEHTTSEFSNSPSREVNREVERPTRLMRAESIDLDLGDDSLIKREENSTPMEGMEETDNNDDEVVEIESTAEAGGDAEEFSKNPLIEDEFEVLEFQESTPVVALEVEENVDVSTKIKKRNTIRNFPPPSEFHLSIRDEEPLRPKNKRMQSCTTNNQIRSMNKSLLNDLLRKNNSPTPSI